ncbi:glycosyltransferase [Clostridium perfringens]|uniref:glycosyltransferase n=1 Tax=Clostridium perfringens TaxID=1502 RepID=UPI002A6711F1|nr:glycosyltransferase [Clostridium perfringens]MDJ8935350.1 glycosyltransferase [Clostridium perfringens]
MKIKILQYVGGMNRAGAETLVMNIFRNFKKEKYEFHFIKHTKEKCDYDDEIIKLGGKIIYLERPSINNIKKYKYDFQKIVDKYGPYDVIHTHLQLMNGLILKTAYECGIKNRVSHAHLNGDYSKNSLIRKTYVKYSRYLIKKYATKNLACSNDSGKYLYNGRDFILLNNAIDLEKFNDNKYDKNCLKYTFRLKDNIKVITHIGRFVEAKNHKFIIDVFSKLIKEDNNYRLFLCGDGKLKEEIENKVKKLNLEKYVYFLGVRDDINKILLGSDLYFMPSILEGLPVSLVEAQAAGCECLISNNIPKGGDLGIGIVDFLELNDDLDIWIRMIKKKVDNKRLNFNIRRNKIIESGFDLNKNIEILEEIYSNLL